MGFLTDIADKFTKKADIEQLKADIQSAYDDYEKQAKAIDRQTVKPLAGYNHYVGVINAEKFGLRDEIHALYEFLSNFSDLGKKLTPFDFEIEHGIESRAATHVGERNQGKEQGGIGLGAAIGAGVGAAGVGAAGMGFLALPAVLPAMPVIIPAAIVMAPIMGPAMLFVQRNKNKKAIEELAVALGEQELALENDLRVREERLQFCYTAEKIAKMYCACIAIVKDAIKYQILPELKAVRCFLFADAIKEVIKYSDSVADIQPNPITYYIDTSSRYHRHYLFVQNSFDFYQVICAFFTKAYLTEMMGDRTCFEERSAVFERDEQNLRRQIKEAESNLVFMEEK